MNTFVIVEIVLDLDTPNDINDDGTPVTTAIHLSGAGLTNTSVILFKKPSNLELGKPNQADQLLGRDNFLGADFFLGNKEEDEVGTVAIGLIGKKDQTATCCHF